MTARSERDPYSPAEREASVQAMFSWLDRRLSGGDAGPAPLPLPPVCGPYGPELTVSDVRWGLGQDGQSAAALVSRQDCRACEGEGRYFVPNPASENPGWPYRLADCACVALETACRWYTAAGVPALAGVAGLSLSPVEVERGRGFDWSQLEDGARGSRVARQIRAWLASVSTASAGSLVLAGPTGVGKTHLAQGLVRVAAFEQRRRPVWVRWRRYLDACRASASERFVSAPFLVVDELSAAGREWGATELEDLLDERGAGRRPTVVTTNYAGDDLRTAVGDRAYSRLVGHGTVVEVPGRDYRLTRGRP